MHTPSVYKSFNLRLCGEFLEGAALLYEDLSVQREEPSQVWSDAEETEARLEAHLDGLVVCGEAAVELCRATAADHDPAAVHAAFRVLCRLGCRDETLEALEKLDSGEPARLAAAGDALAADAPAEWHEDLAALALRSPGLAAAIAPALARLGSASERPLLQLLALTESSPPAPVLAALGRVGGAASAEAVSPLILSDDPEIGTAAAIAMLRLGGDVAGELLIASGPRPWLLVPAALGCGRAAVSLLCERLAADDAREAALLGLGLLGHLSAVRSIFDALAMPEHAAPAAAALHLVTGAPLFAQVFVPEAVDEDALFDDEREQYARTGEAPKRPDGRPFGSTEVRLSTDPDGWRAWFAANKGRFDPARRYRYGLPYSPEALLRTLAAERVPTRLRSMVCDELKTRYGCSFPLSVSMPVVAQRRLLARLGEWVESKGQAFEPGGWYFAARPLVG